jgi:hypothetical protein
MLRMSETENYIFFRLGPEISISMPEPSTETIEEKIRSFANLAVGWDYGRGGPLSEKTIRQGIAWNEYLEGQGFYDAEAFAGPDRELLIGAALGEHYVEVIIEPDDRISIGYDFQGKQVFYRPNLSLFEAQRTIAEVVGRAWNAFAGSILTSFTESNANLLGSHFAILGMTDAFLSSAPTAYNFQALQFATTPEPTISTYRQLSANLPYFGNLTPMMYSPLAVLPWSRSGQTPAITTSRGYLTRF